MSDPSIAGDSCSLSDARNRPRYPWLAALLALVGGPVGQIYAGAGRLGLILWGILLVVDVAIVVVALCLRSANAAFWLIVAGALGFRLFIIADAWQVAVQHRWAPRKAYQRWWIYLLLIVAFNASVRLEAQLFKTHLAEAFVIHQRSMMETILPGDRFLVDKLQYRFRPVARGDVVVFHPEGPGSPPFVMRVVALGGDQIEIRDEKVSLNGKQLEESYARFEGPIAPIREMVDFGPMRVPDDAMFVLGDNRRISKDSRFIGVIPLADVIGKATFVYWSQETTEPEPGFPGNRVRGSIHWDRMGKRIE